MAHEKRSGKGSDKPKSSRDKQSQSRRGSGSPSSSSRHTAQEQQYDWNSMDAEQGSHGPPVDDPTRATAQQQARHQREVYAQNHPGVTYPRQSSRRDTISRQMNEFDIQMGNTNSPSYQHEYATNLDFDGSDNTGGDGYANSNYYYPYQDPRRS